MKYAIILTFLSFSAISAEIRTLGRSPKGLLMGDAYTALADDAYTLFYNPALLARHSGFTFVPLNPMLSVTNALKDPDRFTNVGTDPTDFAEAAMNFPIHVGTNYSPGFKMGKFGLTAIVNYNNNLYLQNQIVPMLEVDYRFDKGFIAGFAWPFWGSFDQDKGGSHFAMGGSIKYLQREGVSGSYNLTSTTLLDAISGGETGDVITALGKVSGQGWGVDIGFDLASSSGPSTFYLSMAILDPFTVLHTNKNPKDLEVQTQPMQTNLAAAWELKIGPVLDITLSAELFNIHQRKDGDEYLKDFKMGLELDTPFFDAFAGMNSGYYSYGIKTNLFLLDIYLGFYDFEIGEKYQQIRASRALLYVSLLDFTFDP